MKNRARDSKLRPHVRNPLRLDPTRTTTLRRAAIADVRRRFARLALAIDELVVRQDSFGLRRRREGPLDPFKQNAFCPTGEGGGIDNSCSPGGGGLGRYQSGSTVDELSLEENKALIRSLVQQHDTSESFKGAATVVKAYSRLDQSTGLTVRHVVSEAIKGKNVDQVFDGAKFTKLSSDMVKPMTREEVAELIKASSGYVKELNAASPSTDTLYRGTSSSPKDDLIDMEGPTAISHSLDSAMTYAGKTLIEIAPGAKALPTKLLVAVKEAAETGDEHVTAPAFYERTDKSVHPRGPSHGFAIDYDSDRELTTSGKFQVIGREQRSVTYKDTLTGKKKTKMMNVIKVRQVDTPIINVFCPTGEGGGVDPSCGAGGGDLINDGDAFIDEKKFFAGSDSSVQASPRVAKTLEKGGGSKETIRIDQLISTQEYTGADKVKHIAKGFDDKKAEVTAFRKNGKTYIHDGHHTAAAARLSGRDSITVRVVDNAFVTNERWELRSSPEQLAAFQEWLKRQLRWYVVGMTEDQLWARYVQEGFRKGAARAFDDVKSRRGKSFRSDDFLQGERRQFFATSFRRPETVEKMKILASRTFEELTNVGEEIRLKLGRVLTDGLARGDNPRVVAREMTRQLEIPRRRAETIARTEIIRAHAEGQLSAMEELGVDEVGVMVEWSTAGDDRVCEACLPMEGVVLKLSEAHNMIPRHPNAVFAGSTFVSYGECLESVRAEYDGPSIMLTAAGGGKHRTAIGPNHPVLTSRGLVNGADLREGDKVLYDLRNDGVGVSTVDLEEIPTHEDVFETILSVCGAAGVSASSSDLHGDRVFCKGEVEAVTPARGLLKKRDLGGIEKLLELALAGADTDPQCVASPRAGFDGCWGVLLPPTSGVSGTHSWVPADDHFVWLRVEKIETGRFVGLAFDYTAESSLYCNDGFVVKNCRCSFIPANVGESDEQVRGKRSVEAAVRVSARLGRDGFDTAVPVSAKRPQSVLNVFCPTGEGGGVDPTCSPGGSSLTDDIKNSIDKNGTGNILSWSGRGWEDRMIDKGHSRETVKELDKLFNQHRWGGENQHSADAEIVRHLREETPIGRLLKDQIDLEESIRDYYETIGRQKMLNKEKSRTQRDMRDSWKMGMGNKDAYSSWEEQWEVERGYEFKDKGPVRYYRKGSVDRDVIPTSLSSEGAQAHSVTGAAQPHYKPDRSYTAKEMHDMGYRVLGGYGYNQMGYSGESEVTWIKLPKPSTTNQRYRSTPARRSLARAFSEHLSRI